MERNKHNNVFSNTGANINGVHWVSLKICRTVYIAKVTLVSVDHLRIPTD